MRLRYLLLGGVALAAGTRYLSSRINRGGRTVRVGTVDDPEVAQAYLRITRLPQFRLMNEVIATLAVDGLQAGRAMDLGSGPGRLAIEMAERAPGLAVIGLDPSESMVQMAESNAAHAGVGDRVTFIKGIADQVPYPDHSFDLVVSTLSLHHWPDPVAVFDEVERILRPDGRFLIFDLRRDLGLLPWLALRFATHLAVPAALRRINEPMASREASYTPRELVEMLTRSSLQDWRVTSGPFWVMVESI